MDVTQFDVVQKIVELIKPMELQGFRGSDVKLADFPFHRQPPFGIIVSSLPELEGESTNETTDIGYQTQVTRVLSNLDVSSGLKSRSHWREEIHKRFDRRRMGLTPGSEEGDCELMNRAKREEIEIKPVWEKWGIDASVMVITTWVRKPLSEYRFDSDSQYTEFVN
jgi:hypothetical protein